MQLTGFHHVTAITADAPANYAFYTQVLGLRLVKRTVNQDDVSAYHLFYADGVASPGTDLTFFDWAVDRERRGTASAIRIGLRVPGADALRFWSERFAELTVSAGPIQERGGRLSLDFDDPEGQRLSLIADPGSEPHHPWPGSPVARDYQVVGLGSVSISVPKLDPTDRMLQSVMNMERRGTFRDPVGQTVSVYVMNAGGEAVRELHVVEETGKPVAQQGAGGVHHVAFRTPDQESYRAWADRLRTLGVASSGPVDRFYFRSLYFRDPSGLLFEIATDGPGFAVDEPVETLGERLALPPFLESRRQNIEAGLRPLV